jgi:hypothetical protein
MSIFQHVVGSGSLDSILRDFATAHGLSDSALADWLEIGREQLADLGAIPAPAPYSETYLKDCAAIVAATGCDSWSLDVVLLWTMGKR